MFIFAVSFFEKKRMEFKISIVVPLFNEEKIFPLLVSRLNSLIESCSIALEVVLVDDGSKDSTAILMRDQAVKDKRFQSIL